MTLAANLGFAEQANRAGRVHGDLDAETDRVHDGIAQLLVVVEDDRPARPRGGVVRVIGGDDHPHPLELRGETFLGGGLNAVVNDRVALEDFHLRHDGRGGVLQKHPLQGTVENVEQERSDAAADVLDLDVLGDHAENGLRGNRAVNLRTVIELGVELERERSRAVDHVELDAGGLVVAEVGGKDFLVRHQSAPWLGEEQVDDAVFHGVAVDGLFHENFGHLETLHAFGSEVEREFAHTGPDFGEGRGGRALGNENAEVEQAAGSGVTTGGDFENHLAGIVRAGDALNVRKSRIIFHFF